MAKWIGADPNDPSDWIDPANWSTGVVPTDTAEFDGHGPTSINVRNAGAPISIGTLLFDAGAPAYSLAVTTDLTAFNITGPGVVNNSSSIPTLSMTGRVLTTFSGASTAGNAQITIGEFASLRFNDTSTAGNSTITETVRGASLVFNNSSTAGNATITTGDGGSTVFHNTSSGGNARLITSLEGTVDFSGITTGATTVGSIEGPGGFY